MLSVTEELQGRMAEQETLLRQSEQEHRDNEARLRKTVSAIEELRGQEAALKEAENQRRAELEQLKNAAEQEIQWQHRSDTAQEQLAAFEKQRDGMNALTKEASEREKAYYAAQEQAEEHQNQQALWRSEWENVKNADTRSLKLSQEQKELSEQKQACRKLAEEIKDWEKLAEELHTAQEAYQQAAAEKERIGSDYRETEQRFLDAQAGMLARELKEGMACPVCGATHHENLARMPEKTPEKEEVERKKKLLTDAEKRAERLSVTAGNLNERLAEQEQDIHTLEESIFGGEDTASIPMLKEKIAQKEQQLKFKAKDLGAAMKNAEKEQGRKTELDRLIKEGETAQGRLNALLQKENQAFAAAQGKLDEKRRQWEQMLARLQLPDTVKKEEDAIAAYLGQNLDTCTAQLKQAAVAKLRQEELMREAQQGEEQKRLLQEQIGIQTTQQAELTGQERTLAKQAAAELEKAEKLCREAAAHIRQVKALEAKESRTGKETDGETDITITDKTANSVIKDYQKMLTKCAGLLSKSIAHRRQLEIQQKQTEESVAESNDAIAKLEKELEAVRSLKNEKATQLFASLGEQELAGTRYDPAGMPAEQLCSLFTRIASKLEQQLNILLEELEQNREKLFFLCNFLF